MKLSDIVEEFKKYLGYDGIISQKDLDQGDSAQRCGHYLAFMKLIGVEESFNGPLKDYYQTVFQKLQIEPGVYRRSSNLEYWGANPNNFSRDQRTGLESAMVAFNDLEKLSESRKLIFKRLGLHQNYDIVSPGEMRLYTSRQHIWERWIWDLFLFGDLALRKDDNYDVDNMLCLQILICYCVKPTLLSKWAMKKYLKTNFMDRVYNYHRIDGQNNGCEPLAWLADYAYFKLVPGYKPKQNFE